MGNLHKAGIMKQEKDDTSRSKTNTEQGYVRKCYKCGRSEHMRHQPPTAEKKAGSFWLQGSQIAPEI